MIPERPTYVGACEQDFGAGIWIKELPLHPPPSSPTAGSHAGCAYCDRWVSHNRTIARWRHFYYNYQNPWVCCFLVQIKAIVLLSSGELTNFNNKAKTKWILVVVVKYRHRAVVLLLTIIPHRIHAHTNFVRSCYLYTTNFSQGFSWGSRSLTIINVL